MSPGFPLATSVQCIQVKSALPVLSVQYAQHLVWAYIPPGFALTRPCWPCHTFWSNFILCIYRFYLFSCVVKCLGRKSRRDCLSPQCNPHLLVANWQLTFVFLGTDSGCVASPSSVSLFSLMCQCFLEERSSLSTKTPLSSPPVLKGPLFIVHCMADGLQFHLQWVNRLWVAFRACKSHCMHFCS